ncbi:MAG: hypothetical protein WAW13_02045 [Minisyncoccia bacterium]
MEIEFFVVLAHIIGTIIGVGGATMIETHLAQVFRDKLVSADERALLAIDYRMVRIGLIITILSGFSFLLIDKFEGNTKYLYSPRMWAKIFIVIVIAGNTLLLQARAINLYWGSALSFVSWWSAAIIGIFVSNNVTLDFFGTGSFISVFSSFMLVYAVLIVVGAVILNAFRNRSSSK